MWAGPTRTTHTHDRGTKPKSKVELFKRGEGYESKKGILICVL